MEHCPGWIIDGSRKKWIFYAIETKDLEFLRILTQTIDPFINTSEYLEFAASIENNSPVIEYLLTLKCPIRQVKVLISAVEKKAFKNLKFLHEKMEFPVDDNYQVLNAAADAEDNIPILEYLMLHDCPFTPLKSAAKNDTLNNLKWLLENGFLIKNEDIAQAAMTNGSLEVLESLKANKCPIDEKLDVCLSLSETIESLIEQGIETDPSSALMVAAEHSCLDKIQWLLKNGYSINDSDTFVEAAIQRPF